MLRKGAHGVVLHHLAEEAHAERAAPSEQGLHLRRQAREPLLDTLLALRFPLADERLSRGVQR